MENVIAEKRIKTGGEATWLRSAKSIIRKINARLTALMKDQADYEKVNRMIEENRLKDELFRMRL